MLRGGHDDVSVSSIFILHMIENWHGEQDLNFFFLYWVAARAIINAHLDPSALTWIFESVTDGC